MKRVIITLVLVSLIVPLNATELTKESLINELSSLETLLEKQAMDLQNIRELNATLLLKLNDYETLDQNLQALVEDLQSTKDELTNTNKAQEESIQKWQTDYEDLLKRYNSLQSEIDNILKESKAIIADQESKLTLQSTILKVESGALIVAVVVAIIGWVK